MEAFGRDVTGELVAAARAGGISHGRAAPPSLGGKWQQWQQDHCVDPHGMAADGSVE
jgi:hypothetical protein